MNGGRLRPTGDPFAHLLPRLRRITDAEEQTVLGELDAVLPYPPGGVLAGHDNCVSFADVRPGAVMVRDVVPAIFAAYVRLLIPL
jgi:hypothetical protein